MTELTLPDVVTIEADDQDAFAAYQTAVSQELQKLAGLSVYQKRRNTIWHLAWAAVTPQISQNDIFKRPDCVSKSIYMGKWKDQAEFTAVLERVTALTRSYVEGKDSRALERRRARLRDLEEDLALRLIEKAGNMLNFPLQTAFTSTEEEEDEDGRQIIHTTIIQPSDKWRQRDAAYIADKASTIGRRALEMTKDKQSIELDVTELTDEELDALASNL
jgi:hypothetical protein